MRRTSPENALLAVLCAATLGCANTSEVLVDLHTDFIAGAEFDEVILAAGSTELSVPAGPGDYLAGVRLGPVRVADGSRDIRVQLRRGGRVLVGRSVRLEVRGTVVIDVWLLRLCAGLVCPEPGGDPDANQCQGGRCVRPECVPGMPGCTEPSCALAEDCPAPAVSCLAAACREGNCLLEPVTDACGVGQWCDPEAGCRELPTDGGAGLDAGPTDASMVDANVPDVPPCPTPCDDGLLCTYGDCLIGGVCRGTSISCRMPGPEPDCISLRCNGTATCTTTFGRGRCTDDGNPCTRDECDGMGSCVHSPIADAAGVCRAATGDGDCCAGVCMDVDVDPANCGGCGITCLPGETCSRGSCGCGGGRSCTTGVVPACCSGNCEDLDSDGNNCGACGVRCRNAQGDCDAGSCHCGAGGPCATGTACCRCVGRPDVCVPTGTCVC